VAYSAYLDRNMLPDLPQAPQEFLDWYDKRAERLANAMRRMLAVAAPTETRSTSWEPAVRDDENAHSIGE
jgi:hypothetical protein